MRLLDTRTGLFLEVVDPTAISYAILSHVWAKKDTGDLSGAPFMEEQVFSDVCGIQEEHKAKLALDHNAVLVHLSPKIRRFCEIAREAGYKLGWIDTCCIDKTSSSELSEAINSMYNWYCYSSACYVYLHDVTERKPDQLIWSTWFSRGWTLQELIAPNLLIFYTSHWLPIGSKHALAGLIEDACGVDHDVLTFEKPLDKTSVARRMSWAAYRETSRQEDRAYSLMGLFGVNMPMLYGEGGSRAFIRLQTEIFRRFPWDHTIFTWGNHRGRCEIQISSFQNLGSRAVSLENIFPPPSERHLISPLLDQYLLSTSPNNFTNGSASLLPLSRAEHLENFRLSSPIPHQTSSVPAGETAWLPLIKLRGSQTLEGEDIPTHIALLAVKNPHGDIVALLLREDRTAPGDYNVGSFVVTKGSSQQSSLKFLDYIRTITLDPQQVSQCRRLLLMTAVNILRHPSEEVADIDEGASARDKLCLVQGHHLIIRPSCTFPYSSTSVFTLEAARNVDGNVARIFTPLWDTIILDLCKGETKVARVAVGRCCGYTEQSHYLGLVVVWQYNNVSERWPPVHFSDHEGTHLRDWKFRAGAAWQHTTLELGDDSRLQLRFIFRYLSPTPEVSRLGNTRQYQLHVEVFPLSGDRDSVTL